MSIRRGTTPTLTITIDDVDFSSMKDFTITISQNGEKKIVKHKNEATINGDTISCTLSQQDTLNLMTGTRASIQVKMETESGEVIGTEIVKTSVDPILDEEVMT